MGKPKFTKYKWVVEPDEEYGEPALMITAAGLDIATLWGGYKSAEADAYLIYAAPDMYEALQTAVGYIEGMLEDGCPKCGGDCSSANPPVQCCPMQIYQADLAKAKSALAKAEGKT